MKVPVISDAPPAGTSMTQIQALNWNGLVDSAKSFNTRSVAGFQLEVKDAKAESGAIVPLLMPLFWQTISWSAFAKLWAELVPDAGHFNPNININDSLKNSQIFVQPASAVAIDTDGTLEVGVAPPPPAPPATPLGAPIPSYPGLRYAAHGDTNPDYFIYTAPDGSLWQRETVITLGPIYQELPGGAS